MKKLTLALLTTLFTFGLIKTGSASNDAGLPGEFLNNGVGARPMGMGRAFTAVADDIDALYWNPAGLATYRSSQLEFQHTPLPLDGAYQYFAYSQPLYALGNFGVGVVNLDSGKITKTQSITSDDYIETGSYDARETAYMAAYANKFGDHYATGLTFKMVENAIDNKSERGFGADWGNFYSLNERVQFGVMFRNLLQPSYGFEHEKETFPTIMRLGSAVKFFNDHLLTALDIEKALGEDQGWRPHFGVEGYVINNIFLRAGIDQTEIDGGVGIRFKNLQFDYAAGFQDIGLVNRFSVKVFFGGYEVDVRATPEVFSPVGLKNKVTFQINTAHRDRVTKWIMTIRNARGTVVKTFQGYDAPPSLLEWDGKNAQDRVVDPGEYTYRLSVTTNKNKTEMTPIRTIKVVSPTPIEIEAK